MLGVQLGTVLGGSVVIESVFGWPGIGSLLFDSVSSRNYPVVLGILVLGSLVVIVANIAVDLRLHVARSRASRSADDALRISRPLRAQPRRPGRRVR